MIRPAPLLRRLGPRPGSAPTGGLSRRGLLTSGVLAGVLAVSGIATAGAARGGTLRLAIPGPLPTMPDDWDLARSASAQAVLGQGALYEGLVEIGPSGRLAGELALSWESCSQARTWTFALDPEARFHDGSPLQATDVATSLEAHRAGGPAAWILARTVRVEAAGPRLLRVILHDGDPSFPFLLAHPRLVIGPDGRLDGTGTGPYRLAADARQSGGLLRLDRLPHHRKDGRAAWFDAVAAISLPDAAARARALLDGEVDAIAGVGSVEAALLAKAGHVVTHGASAHREDLPPPFDRDPELATLLLDGDAHAPGLVASGPSSRLGPLDGGRAALRWWWA